MRSPHRRAARVLVALVAGSLLAAACADDGEEDGGPTPEPTEAASGPARATEGFADLVEEVLPSVVAVRHASGEGSGVIWDSEGTIVTNAHVVQDAATVTVAFADGSVADAEVLATDLIADLAVLDSGRDDLPAATFAEALPAIGDFALAMGNPLGFENTVTSGVVSGLHRSIPGGAPSLVDLVQTDAPISPGNSGGALVDTAGQVIGINVAYLPPQAGAVALGFAIPAPTVDDVVAELLVDGEADHAYLGIRPSPVNAVIAERFDLASESGVFVVAVEPGGPAEAAGIRTGDLIVSLDGEVLASVDELFAALRSREPGDSVTLGIVRDGAEREVEVTLADWPAAP